MGTLFSQGPEPRRAAFPGHAARCRQGAAPVPPHHRRAPARARRPERMASPWSNARSAWSSSTACCRSSAPSPMWRTRTSWSRRPSDIRCCAGSARASSPRSTSGRTRRTIPCWPPSISSGRWIATAPARCPNGRRRRSCRRRWRRLIFANGAADRRLYETAVLATLRERLRGSNIWVAGSRDYRAFEDYLLPAEAARDIGHRRRDRSRPLHRQPRQPPCTSA